jgi:hypothetical protein
LRIEEITNVDRTTEWANGNRLLAALPTREYRRLLPQFEKVSLTFAEVIYEPGDIIRHCTDMSIR